MTYLLLIVFPIKSSAHSLIPFLFAFIHRSLILDSRMRYLAAYLLLVAGGNAAPTAADITALLAVSGIEADQKSLDRLLADLEVI